ncbi:MAG: D-Ala-D-Ala carboxypeptidase family metallohydrolase, partial [Pseudomonadota bacterium]
FVVADLLDALQTTRSAIGRPMAVNSGYRSPAHNRRIGGAKRSYHVRGMAADIAIDGPEPDDLVAAARAFGIGGVGLYRSFRHLDIGPRRTWDFR